MPMTLEFNGEQRTYPDELVDWIRQEIDAKMCVFEVLLVEALFLQDFAHLDNLHAVQQNGEFAVASMLESV